MGTPVAAPTTERRGTKPILIVGGTVVVVVLVSLLLYSVGGYEGEGDAFAEAQTAKAAAPSAGGACGFGPPDDSYTVAVESDPNPPRPEGATLRLTVRHGGKAVIGAKVCMTADMPDMQHPALNAVAKEGPGGRYDIAIKFGMGGDWKSSVVIAEPGKPVVSVTVLIEVTPVVED